MDENVAAAKKALAVLTELLANAWTAAEFNPTRRHETRGPLIWSRRLLKSAEAAEAAAEAGEEDSDEEDKPKMGTGTKAGTSSGVSKEDVTARITKVGFFFFFPRRGRSRA